MSNDDEQDWEVASPANTDQVSKADDEIRNLRAAVKDRLDKEHVTIAGAGAGGEHAVGSARCFVATGDPTPQAGFESGRIYAKSDANYVLEVYDGEWKTIGWALTAHNHTGVYVPEANVVLRNDTHTDASDYCTLAMSSSATSLFDLTSETTTSTIPVIDMKLNGASGICTGIEINTNDNNTTWCINIIAAGTANDRGMKYAGAGKAIEATDAHVGLSYTAQAVGGQTSGSNAVEVSGVISDATFSAIDVDIDYVAGMNSTTPAAIIKAVNIDDFSSTSNMAFAYLDIRGTTPFVFDFAANDLTTITSADTYATTNYIRIRINGTTKYIPCGTLTP